MLWNIQIGMYANSINLSSLVNILNQITVLIGMSAELYYFAFNMDIYRVM